MEKQKKNYYTKEFKEEAVNLIVEQSYRISEAANNPGVSVSAIRKQKTQLWPNANNGNQHQQTVYFYLTTSPPVKVRFWTWRLMLLPKKETTFESDTEIGQISADFEIGRFEIGSFVKHSCRSNWK